MTIQAVTIEIDPDQIEELQDLLGTFSEKFDRELTTAVNRTIGRVSTYISKEIRKELVRFSAKEMKKRILQKKAFASKLMGKVTISEEERFSLRHFKPKQNKKGVTYRISKTRGRQTIPGAFMGPVPGRKAGRLGGNAFIRLEKSRLPIAKLHGISPWGLYVKAKLDGRTRKFAEKELSTQLQKRIDSIIRRRNKSAMNKAYKKAVS